MGNDELVVIRSDPRGPLTYCIGVQLSANDGTRARQRESADREHENRNHCLNEGVTGGHSMTVANRVTCNIIRALRAKSNHLDSVANP